jgi:hypothetical protein
MMAKLVVLITAQADSARDVGMAWKEAGAPGVTFIEGLGLQSLRRASDSMEFLSGMTSMFQVLRQTTLDVVLVLSLVEDVALPERMIHVTESILGDMQSPNKGVLFVLDVEQALGISQHPGA